MLFFSLRCDSEIIKTTWQYKTKQSSLFWWSFFTVKTPLLNWFSHQTSTLDCRNALIYNSLWSHLLSSLSLRSVRLFLMIQLRSFWKASLSVIFLTRMLSTEPRRSILQQGYLLFRVKTGVYLNISQNWLLLLFLSSSSCSGEVAADTGEGRRRTTVTPHHHQHHHQLCTLNTKQQ